MRRAARQSLPGGLLGPRLAAALIAVGCHTTLEPVRLNREACSDVVIVGKKYAICEAPLSQVDAELDCELRGAHLAALESPEENEAVAQAVFAKVSSSNVWLGGSRDDEFVWSWPSGAVFWRGGRDGMAESEAFALWQAGEPNNTSSQTGEAETCLALTAEHADWNDRSCELALPYVCELD
jgi:hypothetical protein